MTRYIKYTVYCQPLDGRTTQLQIGNPVFFFRRAYSIAANQAKENTYKARDFYFKVEVSDHSSRKDTIIWTEADIIHLTRTQLLMGERPCKR